MGGDEEFGVVDYLVVGLYGEVFYVLVVYDGFVGIWFGEICGVMDCFGDL